MIRAECQHLLMLGMKGTPVVDGLEYDNKRDMKILIDFARGEERLERSSTISYLITTTNKRTEKQLFRSKWQVTFFTYAKTHLVSGVFPCRLHLLIGNFFLPKPPAPQTKYNSS